MRDSEILNLIADLRSENEEVEALKDKIAKTKLELENDEDDLVGLQESIRANRERLDDLIDEATGAEEEEPDYAGALSSNVVRIR